MKSIFFSILIFPLFLCSQGKINGKILSAYDGLPIPYANISIQGTLLGTIADSVGVFRISNIPFNSYHFVITAMGFPKLDTLILIQDSTENFIWNDLDANCSGSFRKAEKDIEIGKPKLLLIGGIVPIANSKSDNEFEKKYNIEYYDYGCVPPPNSCIEQYNNTIFKYLDKKFGKAWRKEVRKDVCYLN